MGFPRVVVCQSIDATAARSHRSRGFGIGTSRDLAVCVLRICWRCSMRALTWHGKNDIRCDSVPDPKIEQGRDAIIKVTACAICGSDIHLFDGIMPSMEKGDVLGHETMGEVVE